MACLDQLRTPRRYIFWRSSGALSAPRSIMGKKMWLTTHPRKFGNTSRRPSARPPERPSVRTTGIPMFILPAHFLATLGAQGAQEKTDCTSRLRSIESCQNKVSADQYHLAVSRAQVSTHPGRVFFEVIR